MKRPMTPRGNRAVKDELQRLKSLRPELAEAIEVARAHGDLSENADYDAAKEKSGMVEAKIRDLEGRLSHCEIIDPLKIAKTDRVVFGVTVTIEEVESGDTKVWGIYGIEESDVSRGWISFETPLAKALLGKELGACVTVKLPGGTKEYEIMDITIDYDDSIVLDLS
ncbi:MAG: transcription elongation factor GreA [Bdellovibrionales bacterium]|nr:transcription elongation factor GreA [Bdellovibrionales bacterium]